MSFMDILISKELTENTNLIRSWLKELYEQNNQILENQKKIIQLLEQEEP